MYIKIVQQRNVIIAKIKSVPPSFFTTIPNFIKCKKNATIIVSNTRTAAKNVAHEIRIKTEAINSTISQQILP